MRLACSLAFALTALSAPALGSAAAGDPNVKPGVVVKIAPTDKRAADDKSSNWIRVGQLATGGSMATGGVIEIKSFQWSDAQAARRLKPGTVVTVTVSAPQTIGRTDGDPDRPLVTGSVPNASAGKRQHGAVNFTKEWDASTPQLAKPLAKGSVWIRVATPWANCRVGARYPSIELGGGGKTYVLSDVTVASCGGSGDADDRPTEEVAFYYNRIAFTYAR